MKIERRELLIGSALSLLAGKNAFAHEIARSAQPQQADPGARLLAALRRNRLALTMDGAPAGGGWDWLIREARAARFTLVGEEHGVAETARFSSALFAALRESGYSRTAIELSPPIAIEIEAAARRSGAQGVADFLKNPDVFTFYNMREEVQFVADVIKAAPSNERVLWGFDREIFSDRYMIARLEAKAPLSAGAPLARLKEASANAQMKFQQTKNPDDLFLLAEDPALVVAVRSAWQNPDPESDLIMRTLEESLAVETAERTGGLWPYAQRRAQWKRKNFADLLAADQGRNPRPRILLRFGFNHAIRGANYVNVFDVGTMADEVAALTGEQAFHIIVLPSPGSTQAVPGPGRSFASAATDGYDDFRAGDGRLTRVLPNPDAMGHEVINLRALRPMATRGLEAWNADVVRTIHGYDAAVIWKGAHASTGLESA